MISRLAVAIVVFIVVGLGLTFLLGPLLLALNIPFLVIFVDFFEKFGWVLGAAAGIFSFFRGGIPW